jgi:hypothetical protein
MSEGLLTEEEVKSYLRVDDPELNQLKRKGKLTAFNVGGSFVRYRKDQVISIRAGTKFRMPDQFERNWLDHVWDFFRFYGIYILLFAVVICLITYFVKV